MGYGGLAAASAVPLCVTEVEKDGRTSSSTPDSTYSSSSSLPSHSLMTLEALSGLSRFNPVTL
jgi:hypothetical protein